MYKSYNLHVKVRPFLASSGWSDDANAFFKNWGPRMFHVCSWTLVGTFSAPSLPSLLLPSLHTSAIAFLSALGAPWALRSAVLSPGPTLVAEAISRSAGSTVAARRDRCPPPPTFGPQSVHARCNLATHTGVAHRGTSLIRKRTPLGPFRRSMP